MINNLQTIGRNEILELSEKKKEKGYRLVAISAQEREQETELLYHFDKDLHLENYRFLVSPESEVQSISSIFFCALVFENEIQDQFGITFNGLALDFQGRFLLDKDVVSCPLSGKVLRERKN